MATTDTIIALDVGEKRIGVAEASRAVKIAVPYDTIEVDGDEVKTILELIISSGATTVVVGYPRNQSGEATAQTADAEAFAQRLADAPAEIVFQDESLTSVEAERRLQSYGKPYTKGDIDMVAASLILQDYLEGR